MNALITGIAAFSFFALGVICPHDFIYLPALLSVVVAGGYRVAGTGVEAASATFRSD